MAVYIIRTENTSETIEMKEPYREYLQKLKAAEKNGMINQNFVISLAGCGAFEEDPDYFFDPSMTFAFYRINTDETEEMVMIRHCLHFRLDSCAQEVVLEALNRIRDRMNSLYIPDTLEHDVQYEMNAADAQLIVNVFARREDVKKAGMALISLDIACMARGW